MTRNGTILLVEDNQDDVELTLTAFENHHVASNIVVRRDGEEALNYLFDAENRQRPDFPPEVILLDLKLPKVDGFEVLRRVRADERTRRLPVVILTSSNEEKDLVNSYELGANSFIRKPVDFMQFNEAARQLGLYWLVYNEPAPR